MRHSLHISQRRAVPATGPARRFALGPRGRRVAPSITPDCPPAPDRETQRARAAGGPLDHAHYTCGCGFVFHAQVSTTVECPHCGDQQAW